MFSSRVALLLNLDLNSFLYYADLSRLLLFLHEELEKLFICDMSFFGQFLYQIFHTFL
jgi:hypothetical protein